MSYLCIALRKALSSFLLGAVSVIPVLLLSAVFFHLPPAHPLLLIPAAILVAFASSAFGVLLSFMVRQPEQVMVVFNLVRFPMMFLSDIIIPVSSMPHCLLPVILLQPLTYLTETIRYAYTGTYDIVSPEISFTASLILGIAFLALASDIIRRSKP